jgi:hypothetical protein
VLEVLRGGQFLRHRGRDRPKGEGSGCGRNRRQITGVRITSPCSNVSYPPCAARGRSFAPGPRRKCSTHTCARYLIAFSWSYDVTPDGARFLRTSSIDSSTALDVVVN